MKLSQLFEEHVVATALRKLAAVTQDGDVQVVDVLGKESEPMNITDMSPPADGKWHAETLNVADLIPIQEDVQAEHVAAYLNGAGRSGSDPIRVVRDTDGKLYIQDGHHRVVAAVLVGQPTVHALVATVLEYDTDSFEQTAIYK